MSLRLTCKLRNYELESLKHTLKQKRIQIRDDPLHQIKLAHQES